MPIIRAPRPERNFYMLDKTISEDKRLSWAARGVLIFLLGKPDHWRVSVPALINETAAAVKSTGRDAVYNLLTELIDAGYVKRDKHPDGTIDYTVCEPDPENPDVAQKPLPEKPDPEKPDPENPDVLVNTDKAVRIEKAASTENEASPEIPPSAEKKKGAKSTKVSLQAFLDNCKAAGEMPIAEDDPIYKWSEETEVPIEMLVLCWEVFKDIYKGDASKKQIDWRAHFRNAVKRNWYHLWYFDKSSGDAYLTTAGEQARREHEGMASHLATPLERKSNGLPNQAELDAENEKARELLFGKSGSTPLQNRRPTQRDRIDPKEESRRAAAASIGLGAGVGKADCVDMESASAESGMFSSGNGHASFGSALRPLNKQEALEARNRAVALRLSEKFKNGGEAWI